MKKRAFTLAETLITLVIVGIVAALTVPSMIIKHQKEETVTRLKKAYSTFSQAFVKSQTDFGTNYTFDIDFDNNDEREKAFKEHFLKYIKYNKYCGQENLYECFPLKSYCKTGNLLFDFEVTSNPGRFAYTLDDGICVVSWLAKDHIQLYTDINCKKGPNKLGRDIFQMTLFTALKTDYSKEHGYLKVGVHFPKYDNSGNMNFEMTREELLSEDSMYNCNKNTRGHNCGVIIQMDGWQIKDDYPW